MHLDWPLILQVASGAFGVAGLLILLGAWKNGKLVNRVVELLGLRDPDGRISNRKVLVTTATFAGCVAFVSGAAKSIATSTDHDIGQNLVWLFLILLGGGAGHAALQQKLGGMKPGDRPSGTFPVPSDADEEGKRSPGGPTP